jgi:hypothetical protein
MPDGVDELRSGEAGGSGRSAGRRRRRQVTIRDDDPRRRSGTTIRDDDPGRRSETTIRDDNGGGDGR